MHRHLKKNLPQRVDVIKGPKERPDAASRLALGLTITEKDDDVTGLSKRNRIC